MRYPDNLWGERLQTPSVACKVQTPSVMPVRSLKQSVRCWPAHDQVLEDVQAWTQLQQRRVLNLYWLAVSGSYRLGTAAFGSDLDLILVDAGASGGQVARLQHSPMAELPLTCDVLVFSPAELAQTTNDGSCMTMDLKRYLRWLL